MEFHSSKATLLKKRHKSIIHFIIVILIIGQMFDAWYYLVNHLFPLRHLLRLDLLYFAIKHGIFASIVFYMWLHAKRTLGQLTRQKGLFFVLIIFIVISWFNGSILGFFFWDGPYWGRVVDAETNEPIPDANVMACWDFSCYEVFMIAPHFADARETVTDGKGFFSLPTARAAIFWPFSRIHFTQLNVYKPGYDSHPPQMQIGWNREDGKRWHDKLILSYKSYDNERAPKVNYYIAFYVLPENIKPNRSILIKLNKAETYDEQWRATATPYIRMDVSKKTRVKKYYARIENEVKKLTKY